MLNVGDKLRATAEAQGAAGRAWLTDVSGIVSALAAEWGLTLGEPLEAFNGVLQGEPTCSGEKSPLLEERDK